MSVRAGIAEMLETVGNCHLITRPWPALEHGIGTLSFDTASPSPLYGHAVPASCICSAQVWLPFKD